MKLLPADLSKTSFYMVGIKGTGMTAFTEVLVNHGAQVSGSDVEDTFYTDEILRSLHVPVFQGFSKDNVPDEVGIVIHSAAYDRSTHMELVEAAKRGFPLFEYTEALGAFSASRDSSGVSGVHGKTTTTAMVGTLTKELGLPGAVLAGSGVSNFGGRSTLNQGGDFFVAETCEYRRHFLHFRPKRIILTSMELDHQDYFKDYEDIAQAFVDYALLLPEAGTLIYCADDVGAVEISKRVRALRSDIALIPYGFNAEGDYKIEFYETAEEEQRFRIAGLRLGGEGTRRKNFILKVPGRHNILNATAAIALVTSIYTDRYGNMSQKIVDSMAVALKQFKGCKRRSEILGEAGGVLYMDDYGHHPTAVKTTLEGFRSFFPKRRIVVDFMSHTYSRTAALLEEFASSFGAADEVILHEIYASAREKYDGSVRGETLFERTKAHHPKVRYFNKVMDAANQLSLDLKPGDLFVTIGAGDNWKLGRLLYEEARAVHKEQGRSVKVRTGGAA